MQTKNQTVLSPPLDAKMDIITKTLDVVVGGEIFLLCKGESFTFDD